MTLPARLVIVADLHHGACRLSVAPNGNPASPSDVAAIATAAAIIPRVTPRGVWITRSEFPDFEAMCQHRGITLRIARRPR